MNKFKSVLISSIVAGTVLGALGAGAAYAEPKINTTSGRSCELFDVHGNSVAYPPGTTYTVDLKDGSKPETYTCDGNTGQWVKTARVRVPVKMLRLQPANVTLAAR